MSKTRTRSKVRNQKRINVLVTGDFAADHNIYLPALDCDEEIADLKTRYRCMLGGSVIVYWLLNELARHLNERARNRAGTQLGIAFGGNSRGNKPTSDPTAAVWHPKPAGKLVQPEKAKVWRLERSLALGETTGFRDPVEAEEINSINSDTHPDIMVIEDDAGRFRFKLPPAKWPQTLQRWNPKDTVPHWIVLKMTGPVCQGDLWWHLTRDDGPSDRLVVVIPIGDLRREDVRISQGISWERTAEDLVRELEESPVLAELKRPRHVVIVLNGEGALWVHRGSDGIRGDRLFFDPGKMESEWADAQGIEGNSYGFMSGFTAALTARLAASQDWRESPDMEPAVRVALRTTRCIRLLGHGLVSDDLPGFPFQEVAAAIAGDADFREFIKPTRLSPSRLRIECGDLGTFGDAVVSVNSARSYVTQSSAPSRSWRILDDVKSSVIRPESEPLYGVARRVALFGLSQMTNIPYAEFGGLLTTDRCEIEALRNIRRLMQEYQHDTSLQKPLSLGVFGPPGSGKSFAIKQIAKGILGNGTRPLEFNLSQFDDPSDLIGAFHQVRDSVLEGHTPLVFWDEFDSRDYEWLQYLLAPMQDGKFQEDQITHPIGRCVFVFAGATSYDFENFGPREDDWESWRKFKLLKGPDFKSRLHGFLNVLGPNRRQVCRQEPGSKARTWVDDPTDICFPVRRAVFLRAQLGLIKERANERMEIDHGLLAALLETVRYTHGARSMEKIVQSIRHADNCRARRSGLPTDEVLRMNTDPDEFMRIAVGSQNFQRQARTLAPWIHTFYSGFSGSAGGPHGGKPFSSLSEPVKVDNYAAAMRIPWILSLAGLYLQEGKAEPLEEEAIVEILKSHQELLAREEHELWRAHKVKNGWIRVETKSERSDKLKRHDCLKQFDELSEKVKAYDRESVMNYPTIAKLAGFKIVAKRPEIDS